VAVSYSKLFYGAQIDSYIPFRHSVGIIAIIQGTVNDPTTFPSPSKAHGSHHWAFERLVSAALIPLTAAAAVTGGSHYPVLDGVLAISLIVHSHIGVRLFILPAT